MEKMTKTQKEALATLLFVAIVITAVIRFFQNVGILPLIIVIVGCVLAFFSYRAIKRKKRLTYLKQKYINSRIVDRIFNGVLWQGESAKQLIDSKGNPDEINKKLVDGIKKEVWKYGRQGGKRLVVHLEKDLVVDWNLRK